MRQAIRSMSAVCLVMFAALQAVAAGAPGRKSSANLGDTNADLVYTPLAPCRIIDTRVAGGFMTAGTTRSFKVAGTAGFDLQGGTVGGCGVPSGATSALINFVAVAPDGLGNLKGSAYPSAIPSTGSILNYQALSPALNIANAVAFPICDPSAATCNADITLFTNAAGTHVVADVAGFFRRFPKEQMITSVTPGAGLAGGGTSGAVSLGIDTSAASSGQALTFNGTGPAWANVINAVTAGSGLSGGGTSGSISVSANFTPPGGMNGVATTVARGDHTHYARTIVVSPIGTAAQNGVALVAALSGITTNSATNPFLLKIEPGVYDVSPGTLTMKPYVDIEGSGETVTKVTRSQQPTIVTGTVTAASPAEIRELTIENTGGATTSVSVGVYTATSSLQMRNVTVVASGATVNNVGIYTPFTTSPSVVLNDVTISASGPQTRGIWFNTAGTLTLNRAAITVTTSTANGYCIAANTGSTVTALHSTFTTTGAVTASGIIVDDSSAFVSDCDFQIVAGGGVFAQAASGSTTGTRSVFVEHSRINSSGFTVSQANATFTVRVGGSRLSGLSVSAPAPVCASNWNGSFTFFANTCP